MTLTKVKNILEGFVCFAILVTLYYSWSFTWMVLLFLKLLSIYYRKRDVDDKLSVNYGNMKYERQHATHSYWMMLIPVIQMFLIIFSFQMFNKVIYTEVFALILILVEGILLYVCQKFNLRIYAKGVLYNKNFYTFNHLNELILVKNYNGGYEYYKKQSKKVLMLWESEMDYL